MKFLIIILFLIFFSGCVRETKIEKKEKQAIKKVERFYEENIKLPQLNEESQLSDFIKYAILNNQNIKSAFYEWKVYVETIILSRYQENINISFEAEIEKRMNDLMTGIMFMGKVRDKLILESEMKSIEAREKRYEFEKKILETAFKVKEISYKYWILNEKEKKLNDIIKILNEKKENALSELNIGKISPDYIIEIEREIENVKNEILNLSDYKNILRIQMAKALGIKDNSENTPLPSNLQFTEKIDDEKKLWRVLKENNPEIKISEEEVKKAEVLIERIYKEKIPNFSVGIMKSIFSKMTLTKPLFTLLIPYRKKISSEILASELILKGKKEKYTSKEIELFTILSEAFYRWRNANREVNLYREEIIPRLEKEMENIKASYITATSDFHKLLEKQIELNENYINYIEAIGMREIMFNEISILISGILPEKENIFGGKYEY